MDVHALRQQLNQTIQTHQIQTASGDFLEITPLGSGNEVGRSCIYIECKGCKVLMDCGIHPGKEGVQALPYFDIINPKDVDLILVTHFHVDHCAGLPYFLEKTDFKGRVYMTHPTRQIYNYVMQDFVKVSNIATDEKLFDEKDLQRTLDKIDILDYHQEKEHKGVRFSCYRAGHVLGASMFLIEIDGVKILYTGDYSREEDRHLRPAELPNCEIDVLIVESTYGVQVHEQRDKREEKFTKIVHEVVKRGGKCLLPVFALGRAQEILLIMNEYWARNSDIKNVPIYYSGSLAQKSLQVFQTHRNMMGDQLRMELESGNNPFRTSPMEEFSSDSPNPLVIMASPGMLQNGNSRDLFMKWAPDPKNGIVFTGYSVEGTLAKQVMNRPKTIIVNDQQIEMKLSVEYISFSAHADYSHTAEYIKQLQPPNIVLVHGDANEMKKLQNDLQSRYKEKIKVLTPKNCQPVKLKLVTKKTAKIIGQLAKQTLQNIQRKLLPSLEGNPILDRPLYMIEDNKLNDTEMTDETQLKPKEDLSNYVTIDGIIIKQDFEHLIVGEDEVDEYTQLTKSTMKQTLYVPFSYDVQVLNFYIHSYFADVRVEYGNKDHPNHTVQSIQKWSIKFVIDEIELMYYEKAQMLQIEWVTSPKNDLVADSLSLLILQINEKPTPQLLNLMDQVGNQRTYEDFVQKFYLICQHHFEYASIVSVTTEESLSKKVITVSQSDDPQAPKAVIDTDTREVQIIVPVETETNNGDKLKMRIEQIIKDLMEVHAPVDLSHNHHHHHHHGHSH